MSAPSYKTAAEMRQAIAALSPGPWTLSGNTVRSGDTPVARLSRGGSEGDIYFLAACRQDVPRLLEMMEGMALVNVRLNEQLGELQARLEQQATYIKVQQERLMVKHDEP